jgi:hypothetical protein
MGGTTGNTKPIFAAGQSYSNNSYNYNGNDTANGNNGYDNNRYGGTRLRIWIQILTHHIALIYKRHLELHSVDFFGTIASPSRAPFT